MTHGFKEWTLICDALGRGRGQGNWLGEGAPSLPSRRRSRPGNYFWQMA